MSEFTLLSILIIHYVADFIFQSDWQAKNKSTCNSALLSHTILYSLVWIPFCCGVGLSSLSVVVFCLVTFIAHSVTDYFTSRAVRYFFTKQDHHNGFLVIGFDQVLHYIQLYITLKYCL
jgi:uncharacterized membrane protein